MVFCFSILFENLHKCISVRGHRSNPEQDFKYSTFAILVFVSVIRLTLQNHLEASSGPPLSTGLHIWPHCLNEYLQFCQVLNPIRPKQLNRSLEHVYTVSLCIDKDLFICVPLHLVFYSLSWASLHKETTTCCFAFLLSRRLGACLCVCELCCGWVCESAVQRWVEGLRRHFTKWLQNFAKCMFVRRLRRAVPVRTEAFPSMMRGLRVTVQRHGSL